MKGSWLPAVCGALALSLGAAGMGLLLIGKKAPVEASVDDAEKPVLVALMTAEATRVPVYLSGHGELRSVRTSQIAPEVAGRVVAVHPDFEVGSTVSAGAVLFAVDPLLYERQVAEARAAVAQAEATLRRLDAEAAHTRQQLNTLERRTGLARAQLDRAQQLVDKGIGAETERESAEQSYIAVRQERDGAAHTHALIPLQIEAAQRDLEQAQSRLATAELNLDHTRVRAPFAGRIQAHNVAIGQYLRPGEVVLTLADDSTLELPVQLDAREAGQWLRFDGGHAADNWFGALEAVDCTVAWTESPETVQCVGTLDRVEAFDPESRMLTVVVRIDSGAAAPTSALPLVAGMFCRVAIPGRDLEAVFPVPKTAVSFENTVYLSVDNRLKTVPVTVARADESFVYVASGIEAGDQIVTTRLVNPLDHSLLEAVAPTAETDS